MTTPPANENGRDEVDPRFALVVVALALGLCLALGPRVCGPLAVVVVFGSWRLAASDRAALARAGRRLLAAALLFATAFWLGAR